MAKYGNVVPTKGFQDKVDSMEDGYTKEFFSVYKDAKTVIGAFSGYDTNTLANFDLKATVFGPIDEIATGKTTVDEWQKSLSKAWKDLTTLFLLALPTENSILNIGTPIKRRKNK